MKALFKLVAIAIATLTLGACASKGPEMQVVDHVDLDRFMGDWYVISHIPTFIEKEAYNAVETYAMNPDGTIATTFTFRKGGFDGELKEYTPKGFVRDSGSNALWGMRFIWPIKADYRIVYLDDDYQTTIIGRQKRDFVWLMAREPEIPDARLADLMSYIESLGYDMSEVRQVPQRWE